MKNRIDLAKHFGELGFGNGAEVGVFAGYFSKILYDSMPGIRLICVDNWHGPWGRSKDDAYATLSHLPGVRIIEKPSVEAAKDFPDGGFDFVYIDAAHDYANVKLDIETWTPKVKIGGWVSGDDYYLMRSGNDGVRQAVDEFTKNNGYDLQIIPQDKETPTITHDDRQPQWYFTKDH